MSILPSGIVLMHAKMHAKMNGKTLKYLETGYKLLFVATISALILE